MGYLKLLDNYEKEVIHKSHVKEAQHNARFDFAIWLENHAAQHLRAADSLKASAKSAKRKVVKAKVIRPAKSG